MMVIHNPRNSEKEKPKTARRRYTKSPPFSLYICSSPLLGPLMTRHRNSIPGARSFLLGRLAYSIELALWYSSRLHNRSITSFLSVSIRQKLPNLLLTQALSVRGSLPFLLAPNKTFRVFQSTQRDRTIALKESHPVNRA